MRRPKRRYADEDLEQAPFEERKKARDEEVKAKSKDEDFRQWLSGGADVGRDRLVLETSNVTAATTNKEKFLKRKARLQFVQEDLLG